LTAVNLVVMTQAWYYGH